MSFMETNRLKVLYIYVEYEFKNFEHYFNVF